MTNETNSDAEENKTVITAAMPEEVQRIWDEWLAKMRQDAHRQLVHAVIGLILVVVGMGTTVLVYFSPPTDYGTILSLAVGVLFVSLMVVAVAAMS